jgi:hypothetical protein
MLSRSETAIGAPDLSGSHANETGRLPDESAAPVTGFPFRVAAVSRGANSCRASKIGLLLKVNVPEFED